MQGFEFGSSIGPWDVAISLPGLGNVLFKTHSDLLPWLNSFDGIFPDLGFGKKCQKFRFLHPNLKKIFPLIVG